MLGVGVALALTHVVLGVVLAALVSSDAAPLGQLLERVRQAIPRAVGPHLVAYAALVVVAHALAFRRDADRRAAALEAALVRAERDRLRMQSTRTSSSTPCTRSRR